MNQHIENPGCFKPWPFDPRWSVGGHQQTTNLSKGVTFQPSRKRSRSQNCQVKVFFHHLFFWNELFIFCCMSEYDTHFQTWKCLTKIFFTESFGKKNYYLGTWRYWDQCCNVNLRGVFPFMENITTLLDPPFPDHMSATSVAKEPTFFAWQDRNPSCIVIICKISNLSWNSLLISTTWMCESVQSS